MKFILLINVKMPTIVGILIVGILPFSEQDKYNTWEFYSMIFFFIFSQFYLYEQGKFHAQLSWAWK